MKGSVINQNFSWKDRWDSEWVNETERERERERESQVFSVKEEMLWFKQVSTKISNTFPWRETVVHPLTQSRKVFRERSEQSEGRNRSFLAQDRSTVPFLRVRRVVMSAVPVMARCINVVPDFAPVLPFLEGRFQLPKIYGSGWFDRSQWLVDLVNDGIFFFIYLSNSYFTFCQILLKITQTFFSVT